MCLSKGTRQMGDDSSQLLRGLIREFSGKSDILLEKEG
jgi:hypothetical protein